MGRLTKHGKTSHENGICCTHFNSKECIEVQGNCAFGCKWEEEAWSKLAEYEDLEEQGRLIKLPCKVGDAVYKIDSYYICDYEENYECDCPEYHKCEDEYEEPCEYQYKRYCVAETRFRKEMLAVLGKTIFLTKAEAEKALAEMGE